MRCNIYFEELSDDPPEVIERTAANNLPFWGLRIWLSSPPELRVTPEDDDRSAVTFWFKDMASLNDFVERLYMRRL